MAEISTKNILIISREQKLIEALSSIVLGAGYYVSTAYDVDTISNALLQQNPNLIILDMTVTDVGGFPILEEIRTKYDKKFIETPIIIASESGDLVEISDALKLGIKDYFIKSTFSPEQILQKVKKSMGEAIESVPAPTFIPISSISNLPENETKSVQDLSKIKVLVVEDDKFLRDLATQKLAREGIVVISAIDGEQGITLAEKELPNIILLDILLPGIDGFEVLRRIRMNPALIKTSVVMLSNFGQREDIEKAIGAGADQFFIKANYTLDEIVEEIKKISMHPRIIVAS